MDSEQDVSLSIRKGIVMSQKVEIIETPYSIIDIMLCFLRSYYSFIDELSQKNHTPEIDIALENLRYTEAFLKKHHVLCNTGDEQKQKMYIKYLLKRIEPRIDIIIKCGNKLHKHDCILGKNIQQGIEELHKFVDESNNHHHQDHTGQLGQVNVNSVNE